jgi:hypothetical protein
MNPNELIEILKPYFSLNFIERPKFMLSIGFDVIGDTSIDTELLITELQATLSKNKAGFIEIYGIDEYKENGSAIIHINCEVHDPQYVYSIIEHKITTTIYIKNIYINFRTKGIKYYSTKSVRIKHIEKASDWPELPVPEIIKNQALKRSENFFNKLISFFK